MRLPGWAATQIATALGLLLVVAPSAGSELVSHLRQPSALAASPDYQTLYVANERSGTVSVIDSLARQVVGEFKAGSRLSDIAVLGHKRLLVLDEHGHQLILLTKEGSSWQVAFKLEVAEYPVQLVVNSSSEQCFVTSLWSRAVTQVDLSETNDTQRPRLRTVQQRQLPFEPMLICLTPDHRSVIVAASFDAQLALLSTSDLELLQLVEIPGHNVAGLAISHDGKRVWAAQQKLNPLAWSIRDDVHWGNVTSNLLVSFDERVVRNGGSDSLRNRRVSMLGEPGNGAGDPGRVILGSAGRTAVLLRGVHEVAIGDPDNGGRMQRVPVGQGPSDAVIDDSGNLFVTNRFSDSITVVDLTAAKAVDHITLGPAPPRNLSERGEMLFFDARLALDGWMSCHSCHTNGHTNAQLNDNMSDGSFGAPKRVLSLLGAGETGPWAWNGQFQELSIQVAKSVETTMQGSPPSEQDVKALVAYLQRLPAPLAVERQSLQSAHPLVTQGRELFSSLKCSQCHRPPTYTSPGTYDVGLADSAGNHEFNPPSLRGVARRKRLFHDGRANSIQDVVTNFKHQLPRTLTDPEIDALLKFLSSI